MTSLKIAWVTPFSSASSVSEFSHTILESFEPVAGDDDVSITVFSNRNGENFPSRWPVINIREMFSDIRVAGKFIEDNHDFVFFNMGNNIENHGDIFELAEHCQGIAVLHDVVYQHFYANLIFEKYESPLAYAYAMANYYGVKGLEAVKLSGICSPSSTFKFAPWDTEHSADFPLIDAVLDNPNIIGGIVNSQFCFDRAAKSGKPLLKLRLPGDEKLPINLTCETKNGTNERSELLVVSFGHIQKSKQLDFIVETIAGSEALKKKIRYIIAGKPSDASYVQELISLCKFHGLNDIVTIELSVSSQRLNQLKEQADLFLNVRYPNTEGGSGSLIEQMACGKPVIAMRSGCFSEMEGGVIYIENVDDEKELENAILKLCDDRDLLMRLGKQALSVSNSYMANSYLKDAVAFAKKLHSSNSESFVRGSHILHVLKYDGSIFSPRVISSWPEDVMRGFLDIYFDGKASAEAFDYLCYLRKTDIKKATKIYAYASSLRAFFSESASENQRWRLPEFIPSEVFVFLALASVESLEKAACALADPSITNDLAIYFEKAKSRIVFNNPAERVCLLLSIIRYLPVESKVAIDSCVPLPCTHNDVGRLSTTLNAIVSASDAQYLLLIRNLGHSFFNEKSYMAKYSDLKNLSLVGISAFEHFLNHGYSEGRKAPLKFNAVMESMKIQQASSPTTSKSSTE